MNQWNGIDFFIFLILFLNLIVGMSRGATKEIISFMCLCVAVIFTIKFTVPLTNYLNQSSLIQSVLSSRLIQNFVLAIGAGPLTVAMLNELAYCLSILICFSAIFCACEAALSATGFIEVFRFTFAAINRKLGAALGFIRGYVLVLIFVLITLHIFHGNPMGGTSFFINLFEGAAKRFDKLIIGQDVEKYQDVFKDKDLYNQENIYKMFPKPTNSSALNY